MLNSDHSEALKQIFQETCEAPVKNRLDKKLSRVIQNHAFSKEEKGKNNLNPNVQPACISKGNCLNFLIVCWCISPHLEVSFKYKESWKSFFFFF